MDTDTIENDSVDDLKEILERLGGWPVVDGASWNDKDFKWWELSMKAAKEGFSTDRIISIGIMFILY